MVALLQLRIGLHRIGQRPRLHRHHAGDAVNVAVAHAQTPANIAEGSLGAQGSESDYLRHLVPAVAVYDEAQHFVPPVILKVHVDVRHFFAFEIEEAFEHQAVFQRVHFRDSQAVQHDAGGRAPPDPEQYSPLTHERNDVPHDQEIIGEAGLFHHFQLVLHACLRRRIVAPVTFDESFPAQPFQVGVGVFIVGSGITWQMHLPGTPGRHRTVAQSRR